MWAGTPTQFIAWFMAPMFSCLLSYFHYSRKSGPMQAPPLPYFFVYIPQRGLFICYPFVFDTMPTAWYQKCTEKKTSFPIYNVDLWRGNRSKHVGLSGVKARWENLSIEMVILVRNCLCTKCAAFAEQRIALERVSPNRENITPMNVQALCGGFFVYVYIG